MPAPTPRGRSPDPPDLTQPANRGGLGERIGKAKALRSLLGDALARNAPLLAALKQHRR
jgi:hypothetical protein